ncbi:alpha-amylase family glycosyl hydrolase [Rubellimicrobium aerolatum]|uniref:Alpha-amylase family glycosyl hydrolase n=1 Tax=Rubellimicrobium aerolatum TaxID=490979 RepID=A0ABW0SFK8_9RHOB|nr:alpha-amylase family glycosyl hydrolase [Rubellimicrobium aerolatum]MBP1807300.1 alpha-glucosidase [Rubellimicrobium aerolatum]
MDKDWWRGSVTYQVYPRSFQDSDGDGVGDLPGITARLPRIADLGVDAVWLSPVFRSPMVDMGYDVSDHRDIDPTFGTLADFDALVAEAHRLGLRVLIDQVLNHASTDHPLFRESQSSRDNPRSDWFVWADPRPDGTPPNNWQSVFGGPAWEWDARRFQYYLHNFMVAQPDLNFWNLAVQDWALDTLRFWLDRGVDGFRFDTVNFYFHDRQLRDDAADFRVKARPAFKTYDMQYHLFSKNQPENLAFLSRIRALMDSYGATVTVGEVGEAHHPIEMMGDYTSQGRLHMAYSFEMMEDRFSATFFRETIQRFHRLAPQGWPCWAFSNHDVPRHVTRWAAHAADPDRFARLCAMLLLSFEGSICLYQGEELGQTQTDLALSEIIDPQGRVFWPEDKGRDGCRTPMIWEADAPGGGFTTGTPWLPLKAPQRARAFDRPRAQATRDTYKAMLRLRREEPALRHAPTRFLDAPEPILLFRRGDLLCAFNLSAEPAATALPGRGAPLLAQDAAWQGGRLTLGPNGALISRLT